MPGYGRAPPQSKRSELFQKGYKQSPENYQTREEAARLVKKLHKNGYLAQIVQLGGPAAVDDGYRYSVLYKLKGA